MINDTRCPSCGMATPVGHATAVSLRARAAFDLDARRKYVRRNRLMGLLGLAGGALLAVCGAAMFFDARDKDKTPTARNVTAEDLLKIDRPEKMPDWISYRPERVLGTGLEYVKIRSRQVQSRFILCQVGQFWLLAKIDGHYTGARYEGHLTAPDTLALEKIRSAYPNEAGSILPYMLDAEYDIARTQHQSGMLGGALAVFGALMFFSGVGGLVVQPPPYLGPPSEGPFRAVQPKSDFAPDPAAPPTPRRRSRGVRVVFTLMWVVVCFFVAAIIISQVAVIGAPDDQAARDKLIQDASRSWGGWVFLGSIAVPAVLGYLGRLPGTRR
jgi:hypothetical protein